MQFKKIVGHQDIKSKLVNMVKDQRISHAQLFLGPSGNGGLAVALAFAQFISCLEKETDDSCGHCASCRKYEKLIHPDLHFSYPFFPKKREDIASLYIKEWRNTLLKHPYFDFNYWRSQTEEDNKQANINIAEVHQIIKNLSLKPYESEYKILIMWLPEYLEKQGNALLKLIEEPPANTLFLLVTEDRERILPTLLSRTQIIHIPRPSSEDIEAHLANEFNLPPDRAAEIALMSEGSLATARDLAEEQPDSHFDLMVRWLRFCVTDSGKSLIAISEGELGGMGRENQKNFIQYSLNIMRLVILHKEGLAHLTEIPSSVGDFVGKFGPLYSTEQLAETINLLEKAYFHIERNANAKLLFLDLSLQLVLIFKYQTIRAMADTII